MRFAPLVLLSLIVAPHVGDACPAMTLVARPATPNGGTILDGGGVLLASEREMGGVSPDRITLSDGTNEIETIRSNIAPGLALIAPKLHAKRTLTLDDGTPTKRTIHEDTATTPLVAPKVSKVTSTHVPPRRPVRPGPPGSRLSGTTTIELESAPSQDVFAIVVYAIDKTTATPRAWIRPSGSATFTLSFVGKGCAGIGLSGMVVGETVAIAIVDKAGRLSPRSASLRVTAAK